ncbi:MAG: beta-aspartyl-peptidase [Bacteroidetes bacterium]|nr:MAG: beta-aspartyl-peptidase [Bacteroidota bacterium]
MLLFKNCELYAPEKKGTKDVLIAGQKIIAIGDDLELPKGVEGKVIDAIGLRMIPGLIDAHVHIAGAGGEGGPASRTPELQLSKMLEGGVTTVIGCLGTDGMTRNLESVLMKAKALRQEGVSAWMYTGSYQVPTPTILGDVGKDIAMIDEVIGAGEIAISDHRSSYPSAAELIRIARHARVGGMLGNKAGLVNIHMGDIRNPFKPLYEAVALSDMKFTQFIPTHCNRNEYIFEDAKTWGKKGYVDITASSYPFFPEFEIKPSKAIAELVKAGVPLEHITMTSDACGSLPDFDENGKLRRLEMGHPKSIFDEMVDTVVLEKMNLQDALKVVTSNVADILWLKNKGYVAPGKDADAVLINEKYEIIHLTAMGTLMIEDGKMLKKGSYEK